MYKFLPYIPSKEELIKTVLARYKTVETSSPSILPGIEKLRRLEIKRVKETSRYLIRVFKDIAYNMPFLKELHPFYRELLELLIDINMYKHSLAKIGRASLAVKAISRDALIMIRTAGNRDEIVKARKMFIARICDLLNDLESELQFLKENIPKLKRLPNIDPNLYTIVVAGAPNVGKSSFVRCVSSAKPEIAEYPFTTKQLNVGHIVLYSDSKVQIIDTPGLLDRPLSERSKIELQAILALKHLAKVILFIIDPTMHSGYDLDQQINLLKEIMNNFQEIPIAVLVNKIDLASEDEIEKTLRLLGQFEKFRIYKISAIDCRGTREVIHDIINTYIVPEYLRQIREVK